MKKLLGILSVLVCCLFGTAYAQEGVLTTVTEGARFRAGPGTEWAILTNLDPNTPLRVDGRDGTNNFWIRGIIPDGTVGWMASSATTLSADQLNALPIKAQADPFGLAAPDGNAQPAAEEAPAETNTETSGGESAESVAAPEIAPPAPIVNTAPVRGFSYGGHVSNFGPEAVGWMQASGMTWAKRQWRYIDGQPADGAIGYINDAHAKGFRIVLGVVGLPNQLNNPGYQERYAGFVGELAAAGADAIEVWNEPNIDREWPSGQISGQSYTQLLAVSYNAIKRNNPNTMVISGAPAPTGFFGGCSPAGCDDNAFLAQMASAGAARYMDCVGVHYNEGIVPPTARSGDPRGNSGYYTRYFFPMMEVYSGAFGGRVPLCFTELGYLTPDGFGPLPPGFAWASDVTIQQQAAWLDQAVSLARNSGRVRMLIIWNIDFVGGGADPMGGYAMIRPDGSCPACVALGN